MDGHMALDWMEAQDTLPDLVLLDCMMPGMSGHELAACLREQLPSNVMPISECTCS